MDLYDKLPLIRWSCCTTVPKALLAAKPCLSVGILRKVAKL